MYILLALSEEDTTADEDYNVAYAPIQSPSPLCLLICIPDPQMIPKSSLDNCLNNKTYSLFSLHLSIRENLQKIYCISIVPNDLGSLFLGIFPKCGRMGRARRTCLKRLDFPFRKCQRLETLPFGLALTRRFSPHEKVQDSRASTCSCRHWNDVKVSTCTRNAKIHTAYGCEVLLLMLVVTFSLASFVFVLLLSPKCVNTWSCAYHCSSDSTLFVTTTQYTFVD